MTRFLRRGAAALLTLCLALPLFGCSGSDTPTESKTPRSDTAVATLCAVGHIRIPADLNTQAAQATGGSVTACSLMFEGDCQDCLAKEKSENQETIQ